MDFLQQTGAFLEFRIYMFTAKTSYYNNKIVAALLLPIKKMKTKTLYGQFQICSFDYRLTPRKIIIFLRLFIAALLIVSLKHPTHLGGNLLDSLRI
ncbi:hypothetical protein [Viridibacillus arvi]|uniref:hypothetical protein n=1 Tax=Viridibacillus arvi TaxID=263475 RepID=UPI0034CF484C